MNATSINAPYGVSEWELTGLHPAPSTHVKPPRVKEAVFAIECKLVDTKEFDSRATPGKKSATLVMLEGVNFWVREDAINEERNIIDPAVSLVFLSFDEIAYLIVVIHRFCFLLVDWVASPTVVVLKVSNS